MVLLNPFNRTYRIKETHVFWDRVDYPLPDSLGADGRIRMHKFYDIVKSTLSEEDFGDDMEMRAYGEVFKDKDDEDKDDEDWEPLHHSIRFRDLGNRFERVSSIALDMLMATFGDESVVGFPRPASETNFMLIVKDETDEGSQLWNVIKALLKEGYSITLVVPDADDGEELDGGIDSAYPYLTDEDLSRVTIWNWSGLIKGDGPIIYDSDSDQGSSPKPKRLKTGAGDSVGDAVNT